MPDTDDKERSHLHVVQVGNFALLVGNDRERDLSTGDLIDILDPSLVAAQGVGG